MKVFKFGGASLATEDLFINTMNIIQSNRLDNLLIVISALGKTTNALEAVVSDYCSGDSDGALDRFEAIKKSHLILLRSLVTNRYQEAERKLRDIFTEVEWLLHAKPTRHHDYYYDQIVCTGELMSSLVLSELLWEHDIANSWADARDIIRTDNNFREGKVDWEHTSRQVEENVRPLWEDGNIVITQGFIGCTDENDSTTLGREGSDYTAAIFANLLSAVSLTIWKDVDAVMSADPKLFKDARRLDRLSYTEVIEMAYYGAQVIHPKTIKPLQNKKIPLYVKSFLDTSSAGTVISNQKPEQLPPIIVLKNNQALIQFATKDFSFIGEKPVEDLQTLMQSLHVKPNLTQTAAISLLYCFDDRGEKTDELAAQAALLFDVSMERNLTLLTIRHYDLESIERLTSNRTIVLEQKTLETVQMLIR